MLVKFQNDTEEFAKKIEVLKSSYDMAASSKVAQYCIENFKDMDDRNHKLEKKVEKLLGVIEGLREAVQQRSAAEEQIQILLGEKL